MLAPLLLLPPVPLPCRLRLVGGADRQADALGVLLQASLMLEPAPEQLELAPFALQSDN